MIHLAVYRENIKTQMYKKSVKNNDYQPNLFL